MADDDKRPEPDLIDKDKGRLVEKPNRQQPTPGGKRGEGRRRGAEPGTEAAVMTASPELLAEAEQRVLRGEVEIAKLKRQPDRTDDLQKLEAEQARLIEHRNALFRDVAGNDY